MWHLDLGGRLNGIPAQLSLFSNRFLLKLFRIEADGVGAEDEPTAFEKLLALIVTHTFSRACRRCFAPFKLNDNCAAF